MRTDRVGEVAETPSLTPKDRRKERRLLERMEAHRVAARAGAIELFDLYAARGVDAEARNVAELLVEILAEPSDRAVECLGLGVRMEEASRFDLAAWIYELGVGYGPTHPDVWYWLNNNLGFSLNQIGQHVAAELYCRAAIQSEPERHNAHKNLGVALQGQGQYAEAARSYITAVRAEPRDLRSVRLLMLLAQSHLSEIEKSVPETRMVIEEFGDAGALLGPPGK